MDHEAVAHVIDGVGFLQANVVRNQQIIGIGESSLVLAKIYGMRPSVIGRELNVMAHAVIYLGHESVVAAVNSAEHVGHRTEISIISCGKQRLGDCGSGDRTSTKHSVSDGTRGWRDVGVNKIRQLAP